MEDRLITPEEKIDILNRAKKHAIYVVYTPWYIRWWHTLKGWALRLR